MGVARWRKTWDVETLVNRLKSGIVKIPDFQRDRVWNVTKKSEAIYSLLTIGLPEITLLEDREGSYYILDGLQRVTAIWEFVEGKYKIKLDHHIEHFDEELAQTLEGKKFKNLPEEVKNKLLTQEVGVVFYGRIKDFDIAKEIFTRLNYKPTPLNQGELLYVLTYEGEKSKLLREAGEILSKKRMLGFSLLARGLVGFYVALKVSVEKKPFEEYFKFKRFYDWLYKYLKPFLEKVSIEDLQRLTEHLIEFYDVLKIRFGIDAVKSPYWWEFIAFALTEVESLKLPLDRYIEEALPKRLEQVKNSTEWEENVANRNRQKPKILQERFEILKRIFDNPEPIKGLIKETQPSAV